MREFCRTNAEKRLAEALQAKKWGFKQNQFLEGYEVDFWFPEYHLVVEVDGYTHLSNEQRRLDQNKDQMLMHKGFLVMRISNRQIREQLNECITEIEMILQRLKGLSSKSQINDEWKRQLEKFHVIPEKSIKKPKTIEEYFLSLDDKSG
jgi:very-short-patch-repair endonuclease